ncbi:MAG TPA: mucoidy inhibitor MuiA family protein [Ktedonobacterales bacterium]|nr:mucoidy inhibitor MuiA family protein [Ktedonobacterales bacterium]
MQVELDAPIREVTVYTDQALVIRRGRVALAEAGESEITLGGLPQLLMKESLRATARAAVGARLLGVDVSEEFHTAAPEEQLARLRGEITALERDTAALGHQLALIKRQRGWLNTLGEQSARSLAYGLTRGSAQPDDATRIFSFTRDESERLSALWLDTRRERKDKLEALEAKRREYAALSKGTGVDRLRAVIRVAADEPGEVEVEVTYLVPAASWTPRYDARVNTETATLRLTQQALVSQWTGEDWLAAPLSLSTARPSAAVTLPDEAPTWFIDQVRPLPPPQPRQFAAAAAAPMRAARSMAADTAAQLSVAHEMAFDMANVGFAGADIERAGAAQVFRVTGGGDIPSDGQPHTVGLGDADLPVTLEYVAAPVVASGAHLRALATNILGHTLPAGTLHAFHVGASGEEYVGETRIESVAEGAPLKLYLGVDDSVTVKRELVERDTDKGNLLQGGIRRTTLGYRVTIANRTQAQQRVLLLDRLPVSRHERIKVKALEMRPQPSAQTGLDQLTWTLTMASGEERKVEWRIQIESPADMEVSGLP